MKLRLLGDSVRLRLDRRDIDTLRHNGSVEDRTRFSGGQSFSYALEVASTPHMSARFDDDRLCVRLPADALNRWIDSDDVAPDCEAEAGPTIIVEKDFACLTPRDDEEAAFPHPEAGRRSC